MKNRTYTIGFLVLSFGLLAISAFSQETTENKNVTILSGNVSVDGSSEIRKETLEECIVRFPSSESLEAISEAEIAYVKSIQGERGNDDFVRMYKATVEIPYLLQQKELYIITSRTVQKTEPVIKTFERKVQQRKTFVSNHNNGDMYGGRSKRQYFFSSEEAAIKDAKQKAEAWIQQQQNVVCRN
jgi:hypothetical protein